VEEEFADEVMEELKEAGAAQVICTRVQQQN
jgi:hypothetical protein